MIVRVLHKTEDDGEHVSDVEERGKTPRGATFHMQRWNGQQAMKRVV